MWQCIKCGEQFDEQFDTCWNCGIERPASEHNIFSIPVSGPLSVSATGNAKVAYDPSIIQNYADMLYNMAFWVVVSHAVIGIILGGIIGVLIMHTST